MTKKKVTRIIEQQKREPYTLRADDIQYIIELAAEHPRWSVNRIFKEALRPKIRSMLILPLTPKLKQALKKADEVYQIGLTNICYHILEEWLKAKGMY